MQVSKIGDAFRAARRSTPLRWKTAVIIGATMIGLLAVVLVPLWTIVREQFAELERQHMWTDVGRVQQAFAFDLNQLATNNGAWSLWDDTYAFVQQPTQDYIDKNIPASAFGLYNMNVILFYNRDGKLVYSTAADPATGTVQVVPQTLVRLITPDSLLLRHDVTNSVRTGVVLVPEGPMLVTAGPVLTTTGIGPIQGTVVIGRYVDNAELAKLAQLTLFPFTTSRLDQLPPDIAALRPALLASATPLTQPVDDATIAGYAIIRDIFDQPALVVKVEQPRSIMAQGSSSVRYFALALGAAILLLGVAMVLLLERVVLARVHRLATDVTQIGSSGASITRLNVAGNDELAQLGGAINSMLQALGEAQSAREQALEAQARLQAASLTAHEERSQMQADVIQMQEQVLAEQATPLIPISERVVIMPLIGALSAQRVEQIHATLLHGVEQQRARIAIIDITGVPDVDTQTATMLVQAAQAVRLLGAQIVVTGIQPAAAQTLVSIGADLRSLTTRSTLREGVAYALTAPRNAQTSSAIIDE